MFPGEEEERSVLLGVGGLELIAEPEPPLLLQLQPAHRLPQRASIHADDAQSRSCRREGERHFKYSVLNIFL